MHVLAKLTINEIRKICLPVVVNLMRCLSLSNSELCALHVNATPNCVSFQQGKFPSKSSLFYPPV